MKNRRRLGQLKTDWRLNFREDLCESNLEILTRCEKLQKEGKLAKVFTYNGFVKIVRKRGDHRPLKIAHIKDLEKFVSNCCY